MAFLVLGESSKTKSSNVEVGEFACEAICSDLASRSRFNIGKAPGRDLRFAVLMEAERSLVLARVLRSDDRTARIKAGGGTSL
jgi:hypothetical protein